MKGFVLDKTFTADSKIRYIQFGDACDTLERISYKPGVTAIVMPAAGYEFPSFAGGPIAVIFQIPATDVHSGRPTRLRREITEQWDLLPDETVVELLRYALCDAEVHEHAEWFKFDGKQVRNPHN